jgi:hypothetical protein
MFHIVPLAPKRPFCSLLLALVFACVVRRVVDTKNLAHTCTAKLRCGKETDSTNSQERVRLNVLVTPRPLDHVVKAFPN